MAAAAAESKWRLVIPCNHQQSISAGGARDVLRRDCACTRVGVRVSAVSAKAGDSAAAANYRERRTLIGVRLAEEATTNLIRTASQPSLLLHPGCRCVRRCESGRPVQ